MRKHGVPFDLARMIFSDPQLLTVADLEHSDAGERWFSVGCASYGTVLSLVYLWSDASAETTTIRIISARKATRNEVRHYQEGV